MEKWTSQGREGHPTAPTPLTAGLYFVNHLAIKQWSDNMDVFLDCKYQLSANNTVAIGAAVSISSTMQRIYV